MEIKYQVIVGGVGSKKKHLEVNIQQAKGLDVNKAQGLNVNSHNSFISSLQALYNTHDHLSYHIWNSNEIANPNKQAI